MRTTKFFAMAAVAAALALSACSDDDDNEDPAPPPPPPANQVIVGSWTAYDVSPLLSGLGITGITAQFENNNTYTVVSSAGEASTTFTGTYTVSEEATADGIFSITLNQSEPNSLTSEGIFKVYAAEPDSMWYEVAQTVPSITGVTPPTAEAGFGSTSDGAFGETNIQKYTRD